MNVAEIIARALYEGAGCCISDDERAEYVLKALRAAGYAVVPREATVAMIYAAKHRDRRLEDSTYQGVYTSMIAASEQDP